MTELILWITLVITAAVGGGAAGYFWGYKRGRHMGVWHTAKWYEAQYADVAQKAARYDKLMPPRKRKTKARGGARV